MFSIKASRFFNGAFCQKCAYEEAAVRTRLSQEDFERKANQVHQGRYDYSKADYQGCQSLVCIICEEHGEFIQQAGTHLDGCGCRKCTSSKGEVVIGLYLDRNNIKYSKEECFKNTNNPCRNPDTNKYLLFDFFLPDSNMCIEYDGSQHFKPFSFGGNQSKKVKINNLLNIKNRDMIKNKYCEDNNIVLLRIPYFKFKNIESILDSYLNKEDL